jgi:hypothetical protein
VEEGSELMLRNDLRMLVMANVVTENFKEAVEAIDEDTSSMNGIVYF